MSIMNYLNFCNSVANADYIGNQTDMRFNAPWNIEMFNSLKVTLMAHPVKIKLSNEWVTKIYLLNLTGAEAMVIMSFFFLNRKYH